jgi:hypothetical protein
MKPAASGKKRTAYHVMRSNWLGLPRPVLTIWTNLHWPPERLRRIAQALGGTRLRPA